MDIAAFKVSHSPDGINSTALPVARARSVPNGVMGVSSGKVQMQAHIRKSGVVMDIAAFKFTARGSDATALRAARARSSSIGALEERSIGKVYRHTLEA